MKIIGVTGKSGVGKSTFSKILGERKNIGVIHLDEVLVDIKEKKFKNQIKARNKNNEPVMLSNRLHLFINSHRITFKLFMFLKKKLMKKRVQDAITNFKRDGKDAIVIDGIYLKEMMNSKIFDSIILVRRPYNSRLKYLEERDGITKKEIIQRDLPYRKKFAKHNDNHFDYVIDNIYGINELRSASDKIYDEVVGIKTFDERYIIKEKKTSLKNIVKVVNKTSTKTKKTEEILI